MIAPPLPVTYYTASGARVDFLRPYDTPIRANDLYLHSSRICRNGGARAWSLLQHSTLVAVLAQQNRCDSEVIAYAGVHDLHECYVGDLVTAMKALLPDFKPRIERPWEAHVHLACALLFPPPPRVADLVKRLDHRAFQIEVVMLEHPMVRDPDSLRVLREHPVQLWEQAAFFEVASATDEQNWRRLVSLVPGLERLP